MSDKSADSAILQRTLFDYASALASNAPAPGGGSAVAVVAALAAALGEMVCRFTLGKAAYAEHETEIAEALSQLESARIRLLRLAADDETAYAAYARASALPKENEAESAHRKGELATALRGAAAVPLEVAKVSNELTATLEPVARFGNPNLISDVSVATYLAEAALRGAIANVEANVRYMSDEESAGLMEESSRLEQSGRKLSARLQDIVTSR